MIENSVYMLSMAYFASLTDNSSLAFGTLQKACKSDDLQAFLRFTLSDCTPANAFLAFLCGLNDTKHMIRFLMLALLVSLPGIVSAQVADTSGIITSGVQSSTSSVAAETRALDEA